MSDTPKFVPGTSRRSGGKSQNFRKRANTKRSSNKFERKSFSGRDKPSFNRGNRHDDKRAPNFAEHRLKGVYQIKGQLATKQAIKGQSVYGERLVKWDDVEYRLWDPKRSKLGAAIKKGISQIGIKPESKVLYLGCSTGTTVSHVGEMVGENGTVFALDHAPRVMRDLLFTIEKRKNIFPIMGDASKPQAYAELVEPVDVVFMDISQRNQSEIFLKNCMAFLKPGGFGLLALKSRSVDISKPPKVIYEQTRKELEKHVTIVDYKELDPYEIDHAFFVVKKK